MTIRKRKGFFVPLSKKGLRGEQKTFGKFKTRKEAEEREKEIRLFKFRKKR